MCLLACGASPYVLLLMLHGQAQQGKPHAGQGTVRGGGNQGEPGAW